MSSTVSPAIIVARFLKANHYTETYEAFLKEANLDPDTGDAKSSDWTIEKILEEKIQYDKSLNFEKTSNDGLQGWTIPAPSIQNESSDVGITSNVLHVTTNFQNERICISRADRTWTELSSSSPYSVVNSTQLDDNPILSSTTLPGLTALTTMSGQLLLVNSSTGQILSKRQDHSKYVVQVAAAQWLEDRIWLLATASWDSSVNIYTTGVCSDPGVTVASLSLKPPFYTIKLPTNPECILFVRHPDTSVLHLVISRRDSTHLYYYSLQPSATVDSATAVDVCEAGRQNLAPHSNAWVAFTPSMLALHPSDPSFVAVATSHLPHMKLILVRLLFPGREQTPAPGGTQASQARLALAVQDKEDAAIRLQVSTLAPQTPYSTPVVVWRPDGSGVWVNGDDGVVRGIEAKSGKVVATLKGHEAGTKVRTLWAGYIDTADAQEEVLVSGGFDKRVFIWTVNSVPST